MAIATTTASHDRVEDDESCRGVDAAVRRLGPDGPLMLSTGADPMPDRPANATSSSRNCAVIGTAHEVGSPTSTPRARLASRISSPGEAYLSSGCFAIPRAITSPSAAGRSGQRSARLGGGSVRWAKRTAASVGRS